MGGTLGKVFSGGSGGGGASGASDPSTGQKILGGILQGSALNFGQQQQQPQGGTGMIPSAPPATPVDPGYFAPQQNQWNPQQRNPMSLYG